MFLQRILGQTKALKAGRRFLEPMLQNQRQGIDVNDKRATASDELVRRAEGQNPWRVNPGRGCGVK